MKKLLSGRYLLTVMFGITTCALALMEILPVEAFSTLAGMIVAHYFSKERSDGTKNTTTGERNS